MSWPGVTRSCHSGEVNRDSKVSRNPKIVARELGAPQGAVLLHLETGAYHGLNPVGFVVWELIDDRRTGSFFGAPILPSAALRATTVNDIPFDRLIVLSLDEVDDVRVPLGALADRRHGDPGAREDVMKFLEAALARDLILVE